MHRVFAAALAMGGLIMCACATVWAEPEADALPAFWRVYIGTYTSGASEGIYLAELDTSTGALTHKGLAAAMEQPSFLALHPELPVLYAVGELGDAGTVAAFRIDPETGALRELDHQPSGGGAPCHVAVAPGGRHVATANYGAGNVALFPIEKDGRLGAASDGAQHAGSSVNTRRQEGPHAHAVNFDAAGRFLFVCDLGIDKVMIYRYDRDAGTITPNDPAFAPLAPGAGPRHLALHPDGRFAYVVNELDSTVTAFALDSERGAFSELQTVSTLPEDFSGDNTTAEIFVHPNGRFLYASNRGHDSIAVFGIDGATGKLTALGHTLTGGKTPRNFNLDPSGKFLLAANQQSGNVVVFRVDPDQGTLQATGHEIAVDAPVCVVYVHP